MKDVFICHASEDKSSVVRPLVHSLKECGLSCWIDEAQISWGDSITAKVNDGLASSLYVIVVLSRAFMAKNWPRKELFAVMNMEIKSGAVKVLPLLVGSPSEIEGILAEFPLLNDKLFMLWDGSPTLIARQFLAFVKRTGQDASQPTMLVCGQCKTPFEHGVHVCLGCRGSIVYGLTKQEEGDAVLRARTYIAGAYLLACVALPGLLRSAFDWPLPAFWGANVLHAFVFGVLLVMFGGELWIARVRKTKADLIRTLL